MRFPHILRVVPFVCLAASACHHRGDTLEVNRAWVRLAAVPGYPAAAYLTLQAGPTPNRLIAIDSPAAGSSELHRSMAAAGPFGTMASMQRLDGVDLPARAEVRFAPGGDHVMLFGVAPQVKPGGTIPLVIRFAKGPPLSVHAQVIGAGDPAPDGA